MSVKPIEFQGQPALRLRAPDGATATLLLHGGQLVSWVPAGGDEQLYLSPRSAFGPGEAVRGGVPVCFPQFSQRGPLPKHGFVRTRAWAFVEGDTRGEHAYAVLRLEDDDATRALWPHAFAVEITVSVAGRRIDIEFEVSNRGEAPFEFCAALHTYFRVADVLKAQVEGLQGGHYFDQVKGETGQQWLDVVNVSQEVDRIYWKAPAHLTLREPGRRVAVSSQGFEDVVVWNPGPDKGPAFPDLPEEGWREMICIEAAQIGKPVQLAPGDEWLGLQTLVA